MTSNHASKGSGFPDLNSDQTLDIVAYVVIFLGLLFTFFNPTVGGVLLGAVLGIYFSHEVMQAFKSVEGWYHSLGMTRSIIAGGAFLGLMISIPTFFIVASVVGAITSLVKPKKEMPVPAEAETEEESS